MEPQEALMQVHALFDPATFTLTYVVYDEETRDAVVIDPVLDFDPINLKISTGSADAVERFIRDKQLSVRWVLETHAHADHLSGAQELKRRLGGVVAISDKITHVQERFRDLLALGDIATDGQQFDQLLGDGDVLEAGALSVRVLHTPGHTPACLSYLIGDALFTGDALFMPDYGTGRCDFPGGSARDLYHSVHDRIYALPEQTRVFVGHDYQPGGRELAYETTVGVSRHANKQLTADTTLADYVAAREARDATLSLPRLLFQSIQVNIRAGHLPEPEENGARYIKMPLTLQ